MPHDVFVSRPTAINDLQSKFCNNLELALRIRGLKIRGLGTTDYSNKAPLLAVHQLLNDCERAIILGLKQIFVKDCIEKQGTPKKREGRQFFLPTAWNHLEGGIAFGLNIPLLIISEEVEGGILIKVLLINLSIPSICPMKVKMYPKQSLMLKDTFHQKNSFSP